MAEMTIQFLDVGQGDGIFINFPGGATMLVDLGSTKNKGIVSEDILTYFSNHTKFGQMGQTLDYLILTHGDRDHYNMVEAFLTRFAVKVETLMIGGYEDDYHGLIATIKRLSTGCVQIQPGFDFPIALPVTQSFGGAEVILLAANAPATAKTEPAWRKNTNSIVLLLHYAGVKVILAGDATTDTEETIFGVLMQKFNNNIGTVRAWLDSHVLKVGHHGSRRTSNSVGWIQSVQPRFVFISSDRHGSLDDNTTTGHRLPQTLTLSLIEKYGHLYPNCADHNVISAYDPSDYQNYNANPDLPGDNIPFPHGANNKLWWQRLTSEGIFTSLVEMDRNDPLVGVADQGAQFQLSITSSSQGKSDDGIIKVTSTFRPGVLVPSVSVRNL